MNEIKCLYIFLFLFLFNIFPPRIYMKIEYRNSSTNGSSIGIWFVSAFVIYFIVFWSFTRVLVLVWCGWQTKTKQIHTKTKEKNTHTKKTI